MAVTTAACLLASCSGGQAPPRPTEPDAAATTGPPAVPARSDAAVLAARLDRAGTTLRDRDAGPAAVRRAARLHQLAVHVLAAAPGDFRRRVTVRLRPATAAATRSDVRAARLLSRLTDPEPALPRWRIVRPPPAGRLLRHYLAAHRRTGVPWTYLAAIHLVETRMGRIRGTSSAGARGPMQFLPSTWDLYGAGGDIEDPRDAILAAARLLRANGAPDDMAEALYHYNPSDHYVRAVSEYAGTMQRSRAAYRGYWHWRVLYRHRRGTYVLPVGYPDVRPVLLPDP